MSHHYENKIYTKGLEAGTQDSLHVFHQKSQRVRQKEKAL